MVKFVGIVMHNVGIRAILSATPSHTNKFTNAICSVKFITWAMAKPIPLRLDAFLRNVKRADIM